MSDVSNIASPPDLDGLFKALDVEFVRLTECVVSPGWSLVLEANEAPGIHYNLAGMGQLIIKSGQTIDLMPHTLVLIPPGSSFTIKAWEPEGSSAAGEIVESRSFDFPRGTLRRLVAGDGTPEIILICGYFRATYADAIDLFAALPSPIVENFTAADQLDQKLKAALVELLAQEVGAGAMSTALLRQVLVSILRRSMISAHLWEERFSILKDPKIARAFSDMVARPGVTHSIRSLAHTAGLSRSSFMERFTTTFGDSPINVLRRVRLRRANVLISAGVQSVDQIAAQVGYNNRTSFSRAYKKAYGKGPSR